MMRPDQRSTGKTPKEIAGLSIPRCTDRQGGVTGTAAAQAPGPRTQREGETTMRFMIIVKATRESESGKMPSEKLLADMTKFNEDLVKAGLMLAGEGLHPSSKGARVTFSGTKRTVTDGPFPEIKELIAGFWIWQVKSKEEAIEWVRRCPNPMESESVIEIRQIFESDDFGAELTPELREREERIRKQVASKK
jgi:hypothetical protein